MGAAGAYAETTCPVDSVRLDIRDCIESEDYGKKLDKNPLLRETIESYKMLDTLLCDSISRLNQRIESLETELEQMQKSPVATLTDESREIFIAELPAEQSVPASLRMHLAAVVSAKNLFGQINRINEQVESLEKNLSEELRKKVIPEQITKQMDSFGDAWAIFRLSYMDTFSPEQQNYINETIEVPYQSIYKRYLSNE